MKKLNKMVQLLTVTAGIIAATQQLIYVLKHFKEDEPAEPPSKEHE